jgi:mRNA interferase HigB
VKASYPKASILKAGRVVFNIKGSDYRLVAAVQYRAGVIAVRFFGSPGEYVNDGLKLVENQRSEIGGRRGLTG